ncbi:DUF2147 domain-containing protein [Pelagicoccus sp. SDUM812003]|uniref:DUF2147 domain-containing protein n=1 Tax=Pelagicoccus sp. SDUM812003 TaxID=3041267 RepID=UPI00280E18EE|nr:DUF2147 domain-containing protein [Pelagicoccus sp. SDUM812003]MDQ8204582.1 DUF2147 domain-containing protein [Pelagicoccus sp. SDUM812003]
MKRLLPLLFLLIPCAFANESPVGLWRTIDDETGEAKSLVRISRDKDGTLKGVVEQILAPDRRDRVCEECEGERRDQPILGMTILWGFKPNKNKWSGGEILDPNNGKIYSAHLRLRKHGQVLDVRGYIGISLIGRSQLWQRVK